MKKFTLLEWLIVIAIMGILITILLPCLKKAREASMLAVCMSNMSQINKSTWAYTVQNSNQFMPAHSGIDYYGWDDFLLDGYIGDIPYADRESRYPKYDPIFEFFKCPADYIDSDRPEGAFNSDDNYRRTYSLNGISNSVNADVYSSKIFGTDDESPYFVEQLDNPAETIFATECAKDTNTVGRANGDTIRHLNSLSDFLVEPRVINGVTYIKGVDKTIHNKGFRYPFGLMDGAVRVMDAEDTRKRANWLWLGKKGNW